MEIRKMLSLFLLMSVMLVSTGCFEEDVLTLDYTLTIDGVTYTGTTEDSAFFKYDTGFDAGVSYADGYVVINFNTKTVGTYTANSSTYSARAVSVDYMGETYNTGSSGSSVTVTIEKWDDSKGKVSFSGTVKSYSGTSLSVSGTLEGDID